MVNISLNVIILAAGKGTRMKSELPKVATKTINGPMICSVISAAISASDTKNIYIITGYKREIVESVVLNHFKAPLSKNFQFVVQQEQLGTGHAVKTAVNLNLVEFQNSDGFTLILYGDTPLISDKILKEFISFHIESDAKVSLITASAPPESSYGRIIRNSNNSIEKIVERKDCSESEVNITEVNSGIYLVNNSFLFESINKIKNNNSQKEFYLTDIVEIATSQGIKVLPFFVEDSSVLQGVNSLVELCLVNKTIMDNKIKQLLEAGVTIVDPNTTYIEPSVEIGSGTKIGPNTQIYGTSKISSNVTIEGTCYILNSTIGSNCTIKLGTRIEDSTINNNVSVGPFANLRPGTVLEDDVRIGNFVETKNSTLKKGSKANHLTYLGDAEVGEDSNIGAGTITCSYDGIRKSKTKIGKKVFIGSNSSLVAPLEIMDESTIGAGSVITKRIETGSLALTRAPLMIKPNYKRK